VACQYFYAFVAVFKNRLMSQGLRAYVEQRWNEQI
jgi:hypothetical protein